MHTSQCSLPSNGSYAKLKPYVHIPMFTPKQWELRKVKALCSHPRMPSAIVKTNTHILWMQGVHPGRIALIVYFHPCMAEVTHKHMQGVQWMRLWMCPLTWCPEATANPNHMNYHMNTVCPRFHTPHPGNKHV